MSCRNKNEPNGYVALAYKTESLYILNAGSNLHQSASAATRARNLVPSSWTLRVFDAVPCSRCGVAASGDGAGTGRLTPASCDGAETVRCLPHREPDAGNGCSLSAASGPALLSFSDNGAHSIWAARDINNTPSLPAGERVCVCVWSSPPRAPPLVKPSL